MEELWSTKNQLFKDFIFWTTILIVKVLLMAFLTAIQRFRNTTVMNKEDAKFAKYLSPILPTKEPIVGHDCEDIERVRRAHQNDLENIPILLLAELFYILTNPEYVATLWLFRIAACCRILHTIVYAIIVIPQPARFLGFIIPYFITMFMAIQTLIYFIAA